MIPGVTDRRRMPRLGKIRLGAKAVSQRGTEYPKALDHFNFKDVPEVQEVYGEDCRELPVILPSDDPTVFFPSARKAYRKSGLFCVCDDGETARRVRVPIDKNGRGDHQGEAFIKGEGLDVKEGEMFELPCPGEACSYFESKMCKNLGRLLFILPEVPRFGVYEIATTSYNSIVNVLSVTDAVRNAIGTVCGVKFWLVLKPHQVQPDGKAKTVYVLDLEFRGSYQALATVGRQIKAAGGGAAALLGPAPDETPDDLYAHAGGALDADLGKGEVPPKGKLAAEPGQSKLDHIADRMANQSSEKAAEDLEERTKARDDDDAPNGHPKGCMCEDCKDGDIPAADGETEDSDAPESAKQIGLDLANI